jgi:molecular chaperone DnaK
LSDPIVGIDLGTSNSVVAHADGMGNVRVLSDEGGYKIHPSVVSFHPNGGVVVGAPAKQRKVIDPQNTIYSVKRLIGRGFSSPEVTTARTRMPYQIKQGPNELPLIVTRGGEFAVPEISAIVLDHVRNLAAAQLATPVSRAVVTVPASFNDAQRSATATAGAIAGLTVVRVLNEPTAAALAYGNSRNLRSTIAVYDFGGGTFDITILKLHDQVYEVLGTAGDTFLGGDDLDERLVDKMVAKFLAENRIDLRTNEVSMMRLRAVAEQTKIELSRRSRAVVRVDEIAYGPKGKPLNLQIEITRDEFVSQVSDIIDKTFPVCKEALSYANLGINGIDDVILVGGTTKIPYVRDQVSKFFAKAPRTDVNPEDAVAAGAALQATSLERILTKGNSARIAVPANLPTVNEELLESPTTDSSLTEVLEMVEESVTMQSFTELSSPPVLPERPKRTTAGYAAREEKPDTSYSLPRSGTREVFEEKTPVPVAADLPAPVTAGAIGRLRPTGPAKPLDRKTPVPSRVTAQGVPAAPEPLTFDDQRPSVTPFPAPPPLPPSRPPVPQNTARGMLAQPIPAPKAPGSMGFNDDFQTDFGSPDDFRTRPGEDPPSIQPTVVETPEPPRRPPPSALTTQPMMPTPRVMPAPPSVPAAPPSAPTMMAMRSPFAPEPTASEEAGIAPLDFDDPLPSSTAKGFAPPQTFPVVQQQQRPAPVVMDVTPRGLGIATVAGFCEELIRRNSRLPAEMVKMFTTSRDQQNAVRIVVCQGESRRLDSNVVIGDLRLEGIPPRPRGETSIEVTFSLDASGILQVKARDSQTGREQRASLDLVGGVREQDVAASRDRIRELRR